MTADERAYMLEQLRNLLAIDSPTGHYKPIETYLAGETRRLGYMPRLQVKGGVLADLGGEGNGLFLTAHADTIGLMVRCVNADGSVRVINVGGLYPLHCDQANARLITRGGRVYTGTMRRSNPSLHLMSPEDRAAQLDYEKNLFLYLDEEVRSADDTLRLGVCCGDIIALDPCFVQTPSGYLKSRYLDDKVCVAALLTLMHATKADALPLSRHITVHFSMYEEVGHGASVGIPDDTVDVLAVDIGCCGPTFQSDERKVSIGMLDTAFPYHRGLIDELIAAAEAAGVQYALDLFAPTYGSDANAALRAGRDVRHGLIGPGVLATHGYERTHLDALEQTYQLLRAVAR